jgi:hypothetical protein
VHHQGAVRVMQEEGVMDDPDLSVWPGLLGLAGPRTLGLFASWCIAGYVACYLIDALRRPGVITPIVAPKRFYDHEVIVKALRCVCIAHGFIVMAYSSLVTRSLVGKCVQCGRWTLCSTLLGHPDDVTVEPCYVSVLHIGARDPGRTK